MRLGDVLAGVAVSSAFDEACPVEGMTFQVSDVRPGLVFALCRLPWLDLTGAAAAAVAGGATAILLEDGDPQQADASRTTVPVIRVRDVNQAYAIACANLFGNVHRSLKLYGVTGTKGKTTTCHLMESVLRHAGYRTGLISTLVQRTWRSESISHWTTPEPSRLHELLFTMHQEGVTHVVLEVSSIGIAEARVHGLRFDGLVFTNLGREHLEYHGGPEGYAAEKRRLFVDSCYHASGETHCVINVDDPTGAEFARAAAGRVVTYGLHHGDVRPTSYVSSEEGSTIRMGELDWHSALGGTHNVYNCLAALVLTQEVLGSRESAIAGLRQAERLSGRLEHVLGESGPDVFVDYAHTPESIDLVLQVFTRYAGVRKRAVVLGCSGNSDKSKRAQMTAAALAGSDVAILTTDNPRFEEPLAIIRDMLEGQDVERLVGEQRLYIIPDRRTAIETAIAIAAPGGVVIVLGKGHERTQEIRGRLVPFSDQEIARKALRARHGASHA